MRKIFVSLSESEMRALLDLAQREARDPRRQAALIIRQELEKRDFLQPTGTPAPQAVQLCK